MSIASNNLFLFYLLWFRFNHRELSSLSFNIGLLLMLHFHLNDIRFDILLHLLHHIGDLFRFLCLRIFFLLSNFSWKCSRSSNWLKWGIILNVVENAIIVSEWFRILLRWLYEPIISIWTFFLILLLFLFLYLLFLRLLFLRLLLLLQFSLLLYTKRKVNYSDTFQIFVFWYEWVSYPSRFKW